MDLNRKKDDASRESRNPRIRTTQYVKETSMNTSTSMNEHGGKQYTKQCKHFSSKCKIHRKQPGCNARINALTSVWSLPSVEEKVNTEEQPYT